MVSATASKTGAEKNKKEINKVIKKKIVLIALISLVTFSSFTNPISI